MSYDLNLHNFVQNVRNVQSVQNVINRVKVIKSIQRISGVANTLHTTLRPNGGTDITISPVNPDKTIINLLTTASATTADAEPAGTWAWSARLVDETTVTLMSENGRSPTLHVEVIEYE